MSKLRQNITIGEMQAECEKHRAEHEREQDGSCCYVHNCKYAEICPHYQCVHVMDIDLTDPPRFNEAQMAFFRWWGERGAVRAIITHHFEYGAIVVFEDANRRQIGNVQETSIVAAVKENGETLDLAELLGKDAT